MEKSKKNDFSKNIPFLAISKLRLSTYQCTPSGNPKLKFRLSLPIPKLFSYPIEKTDCLKICFFKQSVLCDYVLFGQPFEYNI